MKEWPKSVVILGKNYNVCIVSDPVNRDNGLIDHEAGVIKISNANQPVEELLYVLLHEITHGVSDNLSDNFEEPIIERFSRAFSDTLIRNKLIELPPHPLKNRKRVKDGYQRKAKAESKSKKSSK